MCPWSSLAVQNDTGVTAITVALSWPHASDTDKTIQEQRRKLTTLTFWPVNLTVFFLYKYFLSIYQYGLMLSVLSNARSLTQTLLSGHSAFLSSLTPALTEPAAGGTPVHPFYQPALVRCLGPL